MQQERGGGQGRLFRGHLRCVGGEGTALRRASGQVGEQVQRPEALLEDGSSLQRALRPHSYLRDGVIGSL